MSPEYSADKEQMQKLKQEVDYVFEVKADRNPHFHRKVMALFKMAYENQDKYNNFDHYRKLITMRAGFYEQIETDKGTVYIPKSISFGSMDEIEFQELFERVLDVITEELGSDRQDILTELNNFL